MNRIWTFILAGLGVAVALGFGASYLARPESASTAARTPDTVVIRGYAFAPQTLRITPGTTVTWMNRDAVAHTVTGEDGDWGSGLLVQGGEFSYAFTEPGTYDYFCGPHPWMQGRIVVGDEAVDGDEITPADEGAPARPSKDFDAWEGQMREMMDAMHGPGSFDAMQGWMEERWGPGAFEAMLQNCPHQAETSTRGRDIINGSGQGMMGSGGMMDGGNMMGGGGTMGGGGMTGGGGMMGGTRW